MLRAVSMVFIGLGVQALMEPSRSASLRCITGTLSNAAVAPIARAVLAPTVQQSSGISSDKAGKVPMSLLSRLLAEEYAAEDWRSDEVERNSASLRNDATIKNGVIRWKSNNSVPPADLVDHAVKIGLPVNAAKSHATRDKETRAFLRQYRRNYKGPSAEERAEARAAHGPGVALTNVITGHKWTT